MTPVPDKVRARASSLRAASPRARVPSARDARRLLAEKIAASQVIFFLVSAALFIPIVAGLFIFMNDSADTKQDPGAGLSARAASALRQLTTSPGKVAGEANTAWEHHGENLAVDEVGLRADDSLMLDYGKVDNLQRAGIEADPLDPYLNYEEFRDALRLGSKYEFHLRLFPVIGNPRVDPFGTAPLENYHIAYVANLTGINIDLGSGEFDQTSTDAKNEIDALLNMDLYNGASDTKGFDGKFYQPKNNDLALYPDNPYFSLSVKQGDVIADTDRRYSDQLLPGSGLPYPTWFWDEWFVRGDGSYRYDAIIFGSGVNLTHWSTPDQVTELHDFLHAGGTVIFMQLSGAGHDTGFITGCGLAPAPAPCLLHDAASGQPLTTPDTTNQILTVPNKLTASAYPDHTPPFEVCGTERQGMFPVDVRGVTLTCNKVNLAVTASDRYGLTGGTLILGGWDFTGDPDELKPVFANYLAYGLLRPAYLDYGIEIEKDASVATAERLMPLELPTGEFIEVKLVFYLWRTG